MATFNSRISLQFSKKRFNVTNHILFPNFSFADFQKRTQKRTQISMSHKHTVLLPNPRTH